MSLNIVWYCFNMKHSEIRWLNFFWLILKWHLFIYHISKFAGFKLFSICFEVTFILRVVLTNSIIISSVQIRCHASNFINTRESYTESSWSTWSNKIFLSLCSWCDSIVCLGWSGHAAVNGKSISRELPYVIYSPSTGYNLYFLA